MRDFDFYDATEPELPIERPDPMSEFMCNAVIGVGCTGMLAGGIVIGAFATAAISVSLYSVLLLLQLVVTLGCVRRFRRQARQWFKMMGELS